MRNVLLVLAMMIFSLKAYDIEIPIDSIKGPTCVVLDTVENIALPFAPERSKYNVVVSDGLAELKITQMYVNHFKNASSIAYVFPLPHEGSINSMKMLFNDSIYTAEIYEKEDAQDIFDSLTNEGKSAALLLQERPNIFQQMIANIPEGDTAYIEITSTLPLSYTDSIYELKLPTMVAPRYSVSNSRAAFSPWNPPATVSSTQLSINVLLQTDFLIEEVSSPTHTLTVSQVENKRVELDNIALLSKDAILNQQVNQCALLSESASHANKDYILRFKRSNRATEISMASYYDKSKSSGYFAMNIFPDELLEDTFRTPREILIMFDISGSQEGWPLKKQKEVANHIFDRLLPTDRIAVMAFEYSQSWAFNPYEVRSATADNIQIARDFINAQTTTGGTELYSAIKKFLETPATVEMARYFIFLTDGFITNEIQIFDLIQNDPSEPTIFTYGSGNNINHYFLETCAEIGNGLSVTLTASEDSKVAVDNTWEKIISPQLDNISVDFGMAGVSDLIMTPSKKLYKGSPITCFGRYGSGGAQNVEVKGFKNGNPLIFEKNTQFATGATLQRMIPQLWAKQMIEKLDIDDGMTESNKDSIISLSVEYQVLSKYTAFLAINPVVANDDNMVDTTWGTTAIADMTDIQKGLSIHTMRGKLILNYPNGMNIKKITIFDLRGRLLFQQDLSLLGTTSFVWDGHMNGQMLANGAYIIAIQTEKKIITSKFHWQK